MATAIDQTAPQETGLGIFQASRWSDRAQSMKWVEIIVGLLIIVAALSTAYLLTKDGTKTEPLKPIFASVLLLANLLPAMAMLVLIGRRRALKRSLDNNINSRKLLHVRLVATFSFIAIVPTFLLVIFASFLFQSGVQFWFSDSARDMLQNAGGLAQGYHEEKLNDVGSETLTMADDIRRDLGDVRADDPKFLNSYLRQVILRKLNESAIVTIRNDGRQDTIAVVSDNENRSGNWIDDRILKQLEEGQDIVVTTDTNDIVAVTVLYDNPAPTYLFAKRESTEASLSLGDKASSVLTDYRDMVNRSQRLQFQFNIALYFISLAIIAIVVWVALLVADRLVRPVNNLVRSAQRIAEGDLTARVPEEDMIADEVSLLSRSFNEMTQQLENQQGRLLATNQQLDERRAFIEAILESVSAGILNIDLDKKIHLANSTAIALLASEGTSLKGKLLSDVAPRFADLIDSKQFSSVMQIGDGPEPQTLAIKVSQRDAGYVITFEDISQQLADQRNAAWSDVARRIAHEIKNPLTPIQLAAERLQRRFGSKIENNSHDSDVFDQLTKTIIRQVGDLRNIVDEFSSFARMPKPVLRIENLADIVGQSVFLFQVAHENISFEFDQQGSHFDLVCDRRQIGQAITNILKNAAESISEYQVQTGVDISGKIHINIHDDENDMRIVEICDNGKGFPTDRDRIVEPYVTTRENGSGLGLAIVRKIIEEHYGEIQLIDRNDGQQGAKICLIFDQEALNNANHKQASKSQSPNQSPKENK